MYTPELGEVHSLSLLVGKSFFEVVIFPENSYNIRIAQNKDDCLTNPIIKDNDGLLNKADHFLGGRGVHWGHILGCPRKISKLLVNGLFHLHMNGIY